VIAVTPELDQAVVMDALDPLKVPGVVLLQRLADDAE
jgi:hypothetical protein